MAQYFYALKVRFGSVRFEPRILILKREPNRTLRFWNFKIRVRTELEKNRTEPYGLVRIEPVLRFGPD